MGAWDYGIFDDDTAYDFFEEIKENPHAFFLASFQNIIHEPYPITDDAHAVLVSAAYMDNLINGSFYRNENEELEDISNVNQFQLLYPALEVDDLKDFYRNL